MFVYWMNTIAIILQISFFLLALYYLGIAIFSLFPQAKQPYHEGTLRFAVVIPAHNEAVILPGLLKSLQLQTYPKDHFSVYVMADRCTDLTYEIARQFHAIPLLPAKRNTFGKGAALADAFTQIIHHNDSFDAFVILDADNLADPLFLEEINQTMQQGNPVVQGYIDSKNPNGSWLSHAYSVWYWLTNRTIQMGYDRLQMGCKLGGTGFAISRGILREIPWEPVSMAEDAEYTLRLALKNQKVRYTSRAIVYDEKPTELSSSILQRIRWTQGITQVQREFGWKLLRYGKWNAFLRFWSDFLIPLCMILFLVLDIFSVTNLLGLTSVRFVRLWTKPLPFLLLNGYLLGTLVTSVAALFLEKKWNRKLLLNLFGFLLYIISWIPAGLLGILKHKDNKWYHTRHQSIT